MLGGPNFRFDGPKLSELDNVMFRFGFELIPIHALQVYRVVLGKAHA